MSDPTGTRQPARALPSHRPAMLLVAGAFLYAAFIVTQYLARCLASLPAAPTLGPRAYLAPPGEARWWRAAAASLALAAIVTTLFARRWRWAPAAIVGCLLGAVGAAIAGTGPVYAPTRAIVWIVRLERAPGAGPIADRALYAFGVAFAATGALLLTARPRPPTPRPSASHGSARWGSGAELVRPDGLLIGRVLAPEYRPAGRAALSRRRRRDASCPSFRYAGDGHLLTVAPTRSGKGTGCVIPNLLTYPGSVLVTDPKGENHAVTARRRAALGQRVHVLDPFDAVGGGDAFNPLDLIDPASDDAVDDARLLADMLVVADARRGRDESFWDEEARGLLTALILHVAASERAEVRTLTHVRSLLTLPPAPSQALLMDMLGSDAAGGLVARGAARLLQKAERERSGVVSTAQSHTHFLDSPRMQRALGRSSFDFADLKRRRVTAYLVLPPERMDGYQRWLRLMIACAMLAAVRVPGQPDERVLFLLDEFAHLGRMQPVERDVGLVGGYGVTFWLLVQDLAQLKGTYPEKWQSFLANCDVLQAFGVNDWDTADYLSRMLGETTIRVASENRSAGWSRGRHAHWQEGAALTTAESARRLLTPDEVLRLPAEEELLLVRGHDPVRARRPDYRTDSDLAGLAAPNPMYAPATAASGTRTRGRPLSRVIER